MGVVGALFHILEFALRETALFAASGFLLLGLGDLAIDALWLGLAGARWRARCRGQASLYLAALPPPAKPGLLAVFIPAWDEAKVIGAMLRNTLASFDHDDYRLYVGCYPNDPATIQAVAAIADLRVRLAIGSMPGPSTKADCLNHIWQAMLADEIAEGRRVKAIILHDAEDVVHPAELRLFDQAIEHHDLVQLPVEPLIHPSSHWISGHYADEFAQSHAREMVVRQALGAAIPSAGVGCAISRAALARMAQRTNGLPFDAASLTEDYELGLKLRAMGCSQAFIRVMVKGSKKPVATREYFPATLSAAVRQKARWMAGIALLGWDRLGWWGGFAERWMRMRDRQSLLAAILLFCGYLSFAFWLLLQSMQLAGDWQMQPISGVFVTLLHVNLALLLWRLMLRFYFVNQIYGWQQAMFALPRIVVGNLITILAAWHAFICYRSTRRSGQARWDKTAHMFPDQPLAR